MKDSHIKVSYHEEDGGYIADMQDLETCSVFGRIPEAALAKVERAKEAWLETARAEGKSMPELRYRAVIYQLAS